MEDNSPDQNFLMKINDIYYELTSSEKRVADVIISNAGKAPHMTISELAKECSVANATISRFCRKLGCRNYTELRVSIGRSANSHEMSEGPITGEVTPEDTITEMCAKMYRSEVDAVTQTHELIKPELIKEACDCLRKAGTVLCMGQGGSMIMAEEAAHLFTTTYPNYFAVSDDHMQISRAAICNKGDVILYFSYSGATRELMDLIPVAHGRGVIVILVTRFPNSPGAQQADVILQCGANESPLQLGSAEAKIAQICLLEILHTEMCRHDMNTIGERKQAVLDALTCKHL
ncbi:MAG: MurR/RpiR family transcriptional regulator [Solobacterium sp.]|jgi:DNA-binding MurR/RpiR family transcriptional regulator|nr:MurR/RpiR family transcriptional regulator [Solobacterium sp.]MCH4221999.1 MurR/RpiR family transcriptional regulator [Solobacterium sp.]MCH4266112.1 MurR/RpiR family transcriptional regulator [Solobacterium sp.]